MVPMKKVVLVTGASRGLGAAAAAEFGRAGWRVAVNYRASREAAERVAAAIVRQMPRRVETLSGADELDGARESAVFAASLEPLGEFAFEQVVPVVRFGAAAVIGFSQVAQELRSPLGTGVLEYQQVAGERRRRGP